MAHFGRRRFAFKVQSLGGTIPQLSSLPVFADEPDVRCQAAK
jgi:hypothetical protein